MRVSFNEEANVFISDDLTIVQRKQLWCLGRNVTSTNNTCDARSRRRERRHRVRSFICFVVDEHKSLKATGNNDTVALFRISSACSKADVAKARQRAVFEHNALKTMGVNDTIASFRASSCRSKADVVKKARQRAAFEHDSNRIQVMMFSVGKKELSLCKNPKLKTASPLLRFEQNSTCSAQKPQTKNRVPATI